MNQHVTKRDVQARVVRAIEALRDGERVLAEQLLEDLTHDLWKAIEADDRTDREAA